ncbi:hypothetical protein [Bdellovibrio sp. BCCA]|uniref:hypothetical protein n=1 Tax=Bdellovibrio sp. BCCA TaxID=3136281 RepID=UPI0030F302AF
MKRFFLLLFVFPSFGWAALPVLNYKNVECQLRVDGKLVKTQSQPLMTLIIEDSLGRFTQIQFGDEQKKIQYQLLLENAPATSESGLSLASTDGAVLVLQNLMIDTLESSSEFSAKDVTWVRIAQGTHSVSCSLKP